MEFCRERGGVVRSAKPDAELWFLLEAAVLVAATALVLGGGEMAGSGRFGTVIATVDGSESRPVVDRRGGGSG